MGVRPYNEARAAANKKYDDKTYKKMNIAFRKDEDKELLEAIEASGLSYTAFFRRLWEQNKTR